MLARPTRVWCRSLRRLRPWHSRLLENLLNSTAIVWSYTETNVYLPYMHNTELRLFEGANMEDPSDAIQAHGQVAIVTSSTGSFLRQITTNWSHLCLIHGANSHHMAVNTELHLTLDRLLNPFEQRDRCSECKTLRAIDSIR